MHAMIDALAAPVGDIDCPQRPEATIEELQAALGRLETAPAPDHQRGALVRMARLSARLHRLGAPDGPSRDRLREVLLRAHHRFEAEGRGELSPRYIVDHGLSTIDEMHALLRRGDVVSVRRRAGELLALAAVAAHALSPA